MIMGRKTQLTIIQKIFTSLDAIEEMDLKRLVAKSGLRWGTCKRYLEIIQAIQSQPMIDIKKTGHNYVLKLNGYLKEIDWSDVFS